MPLPGRGELFAGFGRSDITPAADFPNGIWMAQKHLRATGIHRRLYVSCVILGADADAVALLSYDLTILSAQQVVAIRAAVGSSTGLAPERIWLYVTHNHAAPVTQDFYDREGADEVRAYIDALPSRSAAAAQRAWEGRRAARVSSAKGRCEIGVNRDLNFHGRMITGPNPGGFRDPEVGVIRIDALDAGPIAAIVTYGCHPTFLGPDNTLISPDFPGVTRDVFETVTGTPCLFLQGGAGNVGPFRGFLGGTAEVERCGSILGCEAAQTFLGIPGAADRSSRVTHVVESGAPLGMLSDVSPPTDSQLFSVIARQIRLPTDNPGPTVYDCVEQDLAAATAKLESLVAAGAPQSEIQHATQQLLRHRLRLDRKRMYAVADGFAIEAGAIRLGDVYFASLACEAYAQIATSIKARAPSTQTSFAAYQGPDVIYVAPPESYEPPVAMEVFNSPFGPAAADILIERTTQMLLELSQLG
jgi:hypothetical protein